jgi:hypothetical protein
MLRRYTTRLLPIAVILIAVAGSASQALGTASCLLTIPGLEKLTAAYVADLGFDSSLPGATGKLIVKIRYLSWLITCDTASPDATRRRLERGQRVKIRQVGDHIHVLPNKNEEVSLKLRIVCIQQVRYIE